MKKMLLSQKGDGNMHYAAYRNVADALQAKYGDLAGEYERLSYTDYRWALILNDMIENLACKLDFESVKEEVEGLIKNEKNVVVNWGKIEKAVRVRSDWPAALRSVRKGSSLSRDISWSFTKDDLYELIAFHRRNRYRRKIEDLLTDCNFHTLCGCLENRDYAGAMEDV